MTKKTNPRARTVGRFYGWNGEGPRPERIEPFDIVTAHLRNGTIIQQPANRIKWEWAKAGENAEGDVVAFVLVERKDAPAIRLFVSIQEGVIRASSLNLNDLREQVAQLPEDAPPVRFALMVEQEIPEGLETL